MKIFLIPVEHGEISNEQYPGLYFHEEKQSFFENDTFI